MAHKGLPGLWRDLEVLEVPWCIRLCRWGRLRGIRILLERVSRLGNGSIWFLAGASLWLSAGPDSLVVLARMALAGAICWGVYRQLKRFTVRRRPLDLDQRLGGRIPPLDQYSFPSGHTMHTVCQTLILCDSWPQAAWILGPFTLLTMVARVALGLHFPSDVFAGALLGALVASCVIP
ncbi:MAG: phosphatase PAP2 family protein [Calditrichaeota bacterium]|nr:phosphatase PAP2 family protein [Calditrichota bacterium]MCB9472688.1 phosphatase PAP2 family protein [Candidatus Delongbacteria bacterium]